MPTISELQTVLSELNGQDIDKVIDETANRLSLLRAVKRTLGGEPETKKTKGKQTAAAGKGESK